MRGLWVVMIAACTATPRPDAPHEASQHGFIVPADGGEFLQRNGNSVRIKVDFTSTHSLAMGTQHLDPGSGIPLHRHEHEDEILFVHAGEGTAILDGTRTPVADGATVFVPHGTWHGVESTGHAVELVWVVSPPGLEDYFRATGVHAGAPPKLTPAELDDIGRKHGTTFKR